jgi:hypothetical protein
MVFVSLGLADLDGMVLLQGIAFPGSHRCLRCRVTLTQEKVLARLDPKEGVRTVLLGSDANLGSP